MVLAGRDIEVAALAQNVLHIHVCLCIYQPVLNTCYMFVGKSIFEFRAAAFETYTHLLNFVCFRCFGPKPYWQKVRIDSGIILVFSYQLTCMLKYMSSLGF